MWFRFSFRQKHKHKMHKKLLWMLWWYHQHKVRSLFYLSFTETADKLRKCWNPNTQAQVTVNEERWHKRWRTKWRNGGIDSMREIEARRHFLKTFVQVAATLWRVTFKEKLSCPNGTFRNLYLLYEQQKSSLTEQLAWLGLVFPFFLLESFLSFTYVWVIREMF